MISISLKMPQDRFKMYLGGVEYRDPVVVDGVDNLVAALDIYKIGF
jgi:hypothetical protein